MAKIQAFLVSAEEANLGIDGWAAIKKYESRLIDFSICSNVLNCDIGSAVVQYTWHVVKDGKVYVSHKKYIDLDNDRVIYTFYETTEPAENGTLL